MISVIVPIYNAERTLSHCIGSVLRQTYKNYELLLVNDGSTDGSEQICKAYEREYPCIRYVKKANGGVSSARNLGIMMANGDYVTFVDSDDSIEETFLENLASGADVDLVLSGFHSSEGIVFVPQKKSIKEADFSQIVSRLVEHEYMLYTPWAKLFKREILNKHDVFFDTSLRLYEDTIFVLTYLLCCKSLCILDYDGYFYDGVWGGISKYKLTRTEVEYRCQREYEILTQIESKFHCRINKRYRCIAIDYIDNLFETYKDLDCLKLYRHYHSEEDTRLYIQNRYSFPTYKAISLLKKKALKLEKNSIRVLLRQLFHFFTISVNQLNFAVWDERVIYQLVKANKLKLVYVYLLSYSYLKHIFK